MEEIKVILDTGPAVDITTMPQEERELMFEQLALANPDIPKYHFDSFAELQTEIVKGENRLIKPELKELLLRKLIQLSQGLRGTFNTVIIPIIPSLSNVIIRKRSAESAIGGAPPMRRMRQDAFKPKKVEVPDAIKVRFDSLTLAVTVDGLDYIVPSNEEIDIIGLVVNPICADPRTYVGLGDKFRKLSAIRITDIGIADMISLGNYTYRTASESCEDVFIKPNYSYDIAGQSYNETNKFMFKDLDEKKLNTILNALFEYLAELETYHKGYDAALSVFYQVELGIKDGKLSASITDVLADEIKAIYEPLPHDPIYEKEPQKSDFLQSLEKIYNNSFSTLYATNTLADLEGYGLSRVWNKAAIRGKDDPEVKKILDTYNARKARKEFQQTIQRKALDESNRLNVYKLVIEKKLGAQRLAEVERDLALKPSLMTKASNILGLLKPQEKKVIELEFDRRQKYLDAVINNKCPHVKIYRQFRMSTQIERTKKFYGELSKFFKGSSTTNMITCNACGFDIICPHIKEYTELDMRGAQFGEIKAKLTKYIDKIPIRDQYFCKICGEVISSTELLGDVGGQRDVQSMMNEELKNMMWGELAMLVRYLKFGSLVNVPQLISAMRDMIYPYIFEIEKQILKSKTNTADEIKAKKRLYVTIYGMAYLIHLIMSNKSKKGDLEIGFKNMKTTDPKKLIVDLIRQSLDIIIMSRNIIIREIPGMTNDLIKNKLIDAYKIISSQGVQIVQHASESEDLLVTLVLDPVYKYIYLVNKIDDILNGKAPKKNKFDIIDKIEPYLGGPISKLEKQDDVFAHAKVPKFDQRWRVKEFENLQPLSKGKALIDGKSIYASASRGYVAKSFELFNERIKDGIYKEYMYVDASVDKTSIDAFMDVRLREPHEKIVQKYNALAEAEDTLERYRAMEHAKNFYVWDMKNSRRWSRPQTELGRIYDEDGNSHKWDIYVVVAKAADATDAGKTIELKSSDIAKATESGTRFTGTVVDKKCSICSQLFSKTGDLDEAKIIESLNTKYTINNFFRFYENRCPKGGLHDTANKKDLNANKCSKCGMVLDMITSQGSKEALAYYREYRAIYKRERDEFAAGDTSKAVSFPVPKPAQVDEKWAEEYSKWTFKEEILLDLASKLKINFRVLSCLGAIEKQEYNDVISGAYIPPEAAYRNDTRTYMVNSHIKNLITEYNMLRFFHRLVKPPSDLSALIDGSGINKHKIGELAKKLPDVFNDYDSRFTWFKLNKKPREIVNFTIQSFCELCLRIWADPDRETQKLRHDFVEYIVKKILKGEEMTTKPGAFNWALLYPQEAKDVKEREAYDPNMSEERGEEGYKEEEDEKPEDFGDTNEPFSTDGLDIDDVDRDEFDEDDPGNGIRVGEDRGLD